MGGGNRKLVMTLFSVILLALFVFFQIGSFQTRAATIGDSIPFEYGSGIILKNGRADKVVWGPGLTEKVSESIADNQGFSVEAARVITAQTKTEGHYVDYIGCGSYVDTDGKTHSLDARVYVWTEGPHLGYLTDWDVNAMSWQMYPSPDYRPDINPDDTYMPGLIHMEWHFFEGGTLKTSSPQELSGNKGFIYFNDIDSHEGYYVENADEVFLADNSYLKQQTSGAYKGYCIGTKENTNGETANYEEYCVGYSYTLHGTKGLHIAYFTEMGRGSQPRSNTVSLSYDIVGTIPPGHSKSELTPVTKNIAKYTDTRASQDQAAAAFYILCCILYYLYILLIIL